ncbi:MAG TPA: hypothetical protein VGN90_11925 [Pyrinomonadaceae bacterium]|jgi:hypothetical protein|nr:hypothetical protein [Pyrinomonadaceae bacterium]
MNAHPWKLVGPWYRWQRPGLPSAGRVSRPVFQKYDGSTFVDEFLKDPQRSLKFLDEDFVHRIGTLPPMQPAEYPAGKVRRLSDLGYFPTTTRKLFLDTHKRFYLVVCELHCNLPGFPSVNREQVCEAGFVVRRRILKNLTAPAVKSVGPIFTNLTSAQKALREFASVEPEEQLGVVKIGLAPQGEALLADAITQSLGRNESLAKAQIANERVKLVEWATRYGVSLQLQGWKQIRQGVGAWIDVAGAEKPPLNEQLLKLYPLIPDPRDEKHSARGRTIYFGVVPTGSADTDEFGNARFDETTPYEIRCFVRRFKHEPPTNGRNLNCCGEFVWSLPTEAYQLASHFDLVGTNNRPVSMQLPDLKALEAQAAVLPPNQLAPFRMVSPPDSNLEVTADKNGKVTDHSKSSQICSFSIPLITIVATFVFKLFLPVVTLLFGLFFLLKLKFCIPPSISLSAGVAAELDVTLQLGLEVSVDAKVEIGTPLGDTINAAFKANVGNDVMVGLTTGSSDSPAYGPRPVAEMTDSIYKSGQEANAPSLTARIQFEEHVEAELVA